MNTSAAPESPIPSAAKVWAFLWGLASAIILFPTAETSWATRVTLPDGSLATSYLPAPHPILWLIARMVVQLAAFAAPLVALRRPVPAIALPLLSLVVASLPSQTFAVTLSAFVSLLGVACSALFSNRRVAWVIGGLSLAIPGAFIISPHVFMWTWGTEMAVSSQGWDGSRRILTIGLYALGVALALGTTMSIWLYSRRAAHELAITVRSAEVNERAVLARDLHDVVAHRMSLIAVRAETAPYALVSLSPATREAFTEIARDARGALDEMRTILGVLDRGSDELPSYTPQPGIDDVASLVQSARTAGSAVEVVGQVPQLDSLMGTTIYRIVQESLTNARRHAPHERATVTFESAADAVTLRVSNTSEPGDVTFGRGLAGMKERVRLSGGTLDVRRDPAPDGTTQFVVEATLPAHESRGRE